MTTQDYATQNVEEDAMQLTHIFQKAANAIVEASSLRKEVAKLQGEMQQLSQSVESLRRSNDDLVNELHQIRVEKQEVQQKLWAAEAEISQLKANLEDAFRINSEQSRKITEQERKIEQQNQELDQVYDHWHQAQDSADKLKGHISRVQEAHKHLAKAGAAFSEVVFPLQDLEPEPKAQAWDEVKEAVKQPEENASGPFVGPSGQEVGTGSGEQPRDEHNQFAPLPMAAKDFEY